MCGNALTCWTDEALLHLAEGRLRAVGAGRAGQDALHAAPQTVVPRGAQLHPFPRQTVGPCRTVLALCRAWGLFRQKKKRFDSGVKST